MDTPRCLAIGFVFLFTTSLLGSAKAHSANPPLVPVESASERVVNSAASSEPIPAGRIIGRVTDRATGEALLGANVIIKGTSTGAATDMDGNYTISSAPSGEQTLVVSYIGYERQERVIQVPDGGTIEADFELDWGGVEGEEIVITAQVAGQLAAINEQFSDRTIKNVVSRDRIQELPDNNAAESIGRLPGIAIQRSGGEANKVSIRGLSPKFNTVTVNGVRLPTTDSDDRSVDLSLVSSNILDGIEVRKAITPDMDADAVGGNIDLRLRNAPSGLLFDVLVQGGYTGLQEHLGNYKFVGTVSNRFLNERLGAIATFNFDRYNRSADKAGINWNSDDANPATGERDTRFNDFNLREESVFRTRGGGSLLLDLTIPRGRITGNAFFNSLGNDALIRQYAPSVNSLSSSVQQNDTRTSILTSGIGAEQDLGLVKYDVQASYTMSRNRAPHNYVWDFARDGTALSLGRSELYGLSADSVYSLVVDDSTAALTSIWVDENELREDQAALQLNLQTPFRAGDWLSGYVKIGGKLRRLDRTFDRERAGRQGLRYADGNDATSRCVMEVLGPEWDQRYALADSLYNTPGLPVQLLLLDFERAKDFLDGEFGLGPVADEDLLMDLTRALQSDACTSEYIANSIQSLGQDYDGIERYQAGYALAELNLGRYVTVIPGVRYERDVSRYNGQRFREVVNAFRDAPPADLEELRIERKNTFWLPMIHVDIRPQEWISLRLARTESISRPNYNQYAPITSINNTSSFIRAAASTLRPAHAENYDASIQVVNSKVGLVGVSAFYKSIDDLILDVEYPTQLFVVEGDTTIIGVPEGSNVPIGWLEGASPQLQTTVNNEEPAEFWGYEIEWQTNFPYLPGLLKGLVLNLNYTRGFSETTYHYYRKEREFIPGSRPPRYTYSIIDTTRTGRMPGQSAHIFNATLGLDYKGFSTRLSYLYQSNTASYINPRERLIDSYVGPYSRFDLSIRQKVGSGIEFFANVNNLNNRSDRSFTGQDTGDPDYEFNETYESYRELYGYTIDVGARYRF